MANVKLIQVPWSETGVTLYAIVERQSNSYLLNDADGAFAAAPVDPYVAFTENATMAGLYEIKESRTAWANGVYTVTAYKQIGGSPAPLTDLLVGTSTMTIVSDTEVGTTVGVGVHRTITVAYVLERVRAILGDPDGDSWPDADLIPLLNCGQREAVRLKPEVLSGREIIQLVTGTKQAVTGMAFIKPARNMGTTGATPGAVPSVITEEIIDALIPDWQTHTAAATVKCVVLHPLTPREFSVYPQQPATPGTLEVLQSIYPADVAILYTSTDLISLDDVYANALIDYIVYRALSEDTETSDLAKAEAHRNLFASALGVGAANVG